MAKNKTQYVCQACGAISPKWAGQCGDCGAWNTLEEAAPAASAGPRGGYAGEVAGITRLGEVEMAEVPRTSTGLSELDRALGGGLVHGSVVLLGGDPGIGKSTLLLQTLAMLPVGDTLYVTGEESAQQIGMRARRLGLEVDGLRLLTETQVENVIATCERERPRVLVIDSIQTLYTAALQSAPGSVGQVRESAAALVRMAKQRGITVILVGHVTKDGQLAGPRVLEHMVDTVLYFEGDPDGRYRMLRAVKNRFGAVNELGVFAMLENGLKAVSNPSAIFLSRHQGPVPGSVVMVTREGTRPLLVEVQALVAESHASQPRRITVGLEQNRLTMLLAVLHRHGGVALFDQDVFINVVGGVRVTETAADLPMLAAALSSFRDRALPQELLAFGEVGLAGEIRPVPNGEERLREAAKHGYTRAIAPAANAPRKPIKGMEVIPVSRLSEVLDAL
ncbi:MULTISPECIES: DNA repair protein RadA [unclassified Thioalkalivibrio]|uniref:DNA repair protein RadA n=1 Tax=unclassified Thioalkalivibrio TaxID=2621013 RepID=UPI00037CE6AC|nr:MULTISPECIES: DNA repair protein RadA [unclassified Thioalkalivibrio]